MLKHNMGEKKKIFLSFYFEIIIDSQEGAKKRYKKNAHARAFFLRKEFGRELEASYPRV